MSSTLEELRDERRAAARAISALRLTPVMFELGARPHRPQELYRSYLAQSDIFIGIYWQRYGEIADGDVSGLEDEYELSRGLPRLLYVKVPATDRDARLETLLSRIREEASYRLFRSPTELGRLVRDDLATLMSERFSASEPAPAQPAPHALPGVRTTLFGREQAIADVAGLLTQPGVRMVTLVGPGGVGKTRLAIAVGERVRHQFDATVFVSFEGVKRADHVCQRIARVLGANVGPGEAPVDALEAFLGDDRWLLILDNLEQLVGAARDLDELLLRCPGVSILDTSLINLRLRAEREYPVPPLAVPDATARMDELAASPAVALFLDRARADRPDFALTPANAQAIGEICRRLEGLPLAIELAAARTRVFMPNELLTRLRRSLDTLGSAAVDLPERQRTLRATVEWSVGLLDDSERSLLETAAVFAGGWTLEAVAAVADLEEDRALELTDGLARHSLITSDVTDDGARWRMLDTIRAYVRDALKARPDHAEIRQRHADYYRGLADRADRPMRRGQRGEWVERLQADRGNLRMAVRWYLAHDREPLPHLLRVLAPWLLWPFLGLPDPTGEVRTWIDKTLPDADSLAPLPRAELLWAAVLVSLEASDDAEALRRRDRLVPALQQIDDPYLRAVGQLTLAWTTVLTWDLDRGVREAASALQRLRGQDEPMWTAVALTTVGALEGAIGRHDDALRHLTELRELADRLGNEWLAASARVQLGTLSLLQGRLDEARALFEDALDRSVAADNTHSVTVCLVAFARLAVAQGDAEQAARLMGAAGDLRRRSGLRVWTSVRAEDRLISELRAALGADRFAEAFASGSRLTRAEAIAAARLVPQPARG